MILGGGLGYREVNDETIAVAEEGDSERLVSSGERRLYTRDQTGSQPVTGISRRQ